VIASLLALPRASDFQAAWYLSLLGFAMVCLVVAGCVLVQLLLAPMWRAGDRTLAVLVGTVAGITAVFFAFLFAVVGEGLITRTLGG